MLVYWKCSVPSSRSCMFVCIMCQLSMLRSDLPCIVQCCLFLGPDCSDILMGLE